MAKKQKRTLSPEHKQKLKEGRKRAYGAKVMFEPEPTQEIEVEKQETPQSPPLTAPQGLSNEQLANMVIQMQQTMIQMQQTINAAVQPTEKLDAVVDMTGARIGKNGVQGIVSKWSIEKSHYPDPTERLQNEPRLSRFAMKENYIFRWSVDGVTYEKYGVTYSEPRFTLELFRRLYDEDGIATGRMALVARNMMHEDEMVTRMSAMRLGILNDYEESDAGFRQLMDEIRYHRMQQWLFNIFTPPKVTTFRKKSRTENISGKIVETFDTEELTDHDTGVAQANSIQSQAGVGSVITPKA